MGTSDSAPRRVRVERNIYQRSTGVFEVGFKDAAGKQRWKTIDGGITAARAVRDQLLAQRHRGELATGRTRLRFRDAAEAWLAGPVKDLRPRTDECYRNAVETHLVPRFGGMRLDSVGPEVPPPWYGRFVRPVSPSRQERSSLESSIGSIGLPPGDLGGAAPIPSR